MRYRNALTRKGEELRRQIHGDATVDAGSNTDGFMALIEDAINEWEYGIVWARPGLDIKTRSAVGLTMVSLHGIEADIKEHVRLCLRQGWSPVEIGEMFVHFLVYAGVYKARMAFQAADKVFKELKLPLPSAEEPTFVGSEDPAQALAENVREGRRVRAELFGAEFITGLLGAPDPFMDIFNDATHAYAFGMVWQRRALGLRTRILLTLGAAAAAGQFGGVKRHVRSAVTEGLSRQVIAEVLLQAYAYSGAPASVGSFNAAKEVFREMEMEAARRKA